VDVHYVQLYIFRAAGTYLCAFMNLKYLHSLIDCCFLIILAFSLPVSPDFGWETAGSRLFLYLFTSIFSIWIENCRFLFILASLYQHLLNLDRKLLILVYSCILHQYLLNLDRRLLTIVYYCISLPVSPQS